MGKARRHPTFERAKRNLNNVLPIARRDANTNEYLHGFYNGLEMAKNCITGKIPDFVGKDEIGGRYRNEKFKRGGSRV